MAAEEQCLLGNQHMVIHPCLHLPAWHPAQPTCPLPPVRAQQGLLHPTLPLAAKARENFLHLAVDLETTGITLPAMQGGRLLLRLQAAQRAADSHPSSLAASATIPIRAMSFLIRGSVLRLLDLVRVLARLPMAAAGKDPSFTAADLAIIITRTTNRSIITIINSIQALVHQHIRTDRSKWRRNAAFPSPCRRFLPRHPEAIL